MKRLVLITVMMITVVGCNSKNSNKNDQEVKSSSTKTTSGKVGKLLFFLNPAGAPCQMQNQIIESIKDKIGKKVDIVYYKTSAQEDLQQFYKYGVRALPSIIILNNDNMEFKRFPPGIQSSEILLSTLNQLK